ncbi:MAG TPA: hypothetical protein VEW25_05815 [Allosphingosinicella sp.]|nr:hypothetical protein [Allosphingosinicella sp.]
MTVSLLAALLLIAQPAPEQAVEEPVAVEAEAEMQIEAPPPEAAPPPAAPAQPAPPAVVEAEATAAAEPEEPEICRRRIVPSERIGQRHRTITTCRTRAEWERSRRGG